MELTLLRAYFPGGTNGELYHGSELVCYTIELPWRENKRVVSCIPEGRYQLARRYSKRYGHHLLVQDVPGRSLILVHPANDALKELRGCVAPVSRLSGVGKGQASRAAMSKVAALVSNREEKELIYVTIKNKKHEHHTKSTGTDTEVFP
jgi:hypothetical protein